MNYSRLAYEQISMQADILLRSGKSAEASRLLRHGLKKAKRARDEAYVLFFRAQKAHHVERNYKSALGFYRQALGLAARNILFLKSVEIALKLLRRAEEDMEYSRPESVTSRNGLVISRKRGACLKLYGRTYDAVVYLNGVPTAHMEPA